MRLRVKREQTAYVHNRRYREGQIVDVPEKLLKKADAAFIDALEKQRAKELGPIEAKKHGLKVGAVVLPKWAELPNKPVSAEPGLPGATSGSPRVPSKTAGQQPPEGADEVPEGEEAGAAAGGGEGGSQSVL